MRQSLNKENNKKIRKKIRFFLRDHLRKISLMISLSFEGMKNVSKIPCENEFTFYTRRHKYSIPIPLACFISPVVAKLVVSDPTTRSLRINIEDAYNEFSQIIKLSAGNSIKIDDSNFNELLEIGDLLGNKEIVKMAIDWKFSSEELSIENVVERASIIAKYKIKHEETVEFIRKHFTEIPYYEFEKCSYDTLNFICSIPGLEVESESVLFNFIHKIVLDMGPDYFDLFGCVLFEYVTPDDMKKFTDMMTEERMTGTIWESLKRRLNMKVFPDWKSEKRHEFSGCKEDSIARACERIYYNGEDKWNGIINRLWKLYGANPHNAGKIRVDVSSTYNGCPQQNVIDYSWDNYWYSCNEENSWFCIDFLRNMVIPRSYVLRSGKGGLSLKSWVVEASNDGIDWSIIDEHKDVIDFRTRFSIKSFEIKNEEAKEYRMIRIRQTSRNNNGSNNLEISRIEIYGDLILAE